MAQYFYVDDMNVTQENRREDAQARQFQTPEHGQGDMNQQPLLHLYQSPPGTPQASHGQFQPQWVIQNDNGMSSGNTTTYQAQPQIIYQNTHNQSTAQAPSLMAGNMIVHQPVSMGTVQLPTRSLNTYIIQQQPGQEQSKMLTVTPQQMMRTVATAPNPTRPQLVPFILNSGFRNQMQITRNPNQQQSVIIQQQPAVSTPQQQPQTNQVIIDPRNFSIIQQTAQPVTAPTVQTVPVRQQNPQPVTYKLIQTKGPTGTAPVRFARAPVPQSSIYQRTIASQPARAPFPPRITRPQFRVIRNNTPTTTAVTRPTVAPRTTSPIIRLRAMLPSTTNPRPQVVRAQPTPRPRHSVPVRISNSLTAASTIPAMVRQPAQNLLAEPLRQPVCVYKPLVEVREPDAAPSDDDIENSLSRAILHKTNSTTPINNNNSAPAQVNPNGSGVSLVAAAAPAMQEQVISTCRNDTAKMLVCLPDDERRLITFTLPTESCTVTELLEQVGINITPNMTVKCLSLTDNTLDYVVTIETNPPQELPELPAPPLAQQQQQQLTAVQQYGQSPQPVNKSVICPAPAPPKAAPIHIPKLIEGYLAICGHCGVTSIDHAKCERCGRTLVSPQKRPMVVTRTATPVISRPTPSIIRTVNGTTTAARGRAAKLLPLGRSKVVVSKPVASPRGGRGATRGRGRSSKKIEEPVVYTLSSEDEEEKEDEGGGGGGRKVAYPFEPSISPQKLAEQGVSDAERLDVCSDVTSANSVDTTVECSSIRFGSYAVPATGPLSVVITHLGIKFLVPKVADSDELVKLNIQHREIMKFIVHYEKHLPVIFLYTTPSCGRYIRRALGMGNALDPVRPPPPFYDPANNLEQVKRIVIVAKAIRDDTKQAIKIIFPLAMYDEISHRDALELLNRSNGGPDVDGAAGGSNSAGAGNSNTNNKPVESSESKADRMTTRGRAMELAAGASSPEEQIHKLLIYPQGKGGISINTEDYKCLAVDQFLNDVIIDFYLKYIQLEIMTPVQREKAHIFSSFFYKRLTATSARQRHLERELKMTPAQKRHNRVKSWTKNVNLFEKDFIVIPINELSHWFLAVICFPGAETSRSLRTGQAVSLNKAPRYSRQLSSSSSQGLTKQAVKEMGKRNPSGLSVTIGNTTITPVSKREENIYVNEETLSERDEAEGDESDIMTDEEEANGAGETINASQDEPISQPCILLFDSLKGAYRSRVVATLREYITCEFRARNADRTPREFDKVHMPGHNVNIPQQNNYTDCGLFLLQYVEELSRHPIQDFKLPLKGLKDWFEIDEVTKKREDIAILIKDMLGKEHPERVELLPEIQFPTVNGVVVDEQQPAPPLIETNNSLLIKKVKTQKAEAEEDEEVDSEELFYEVENSCVNEDDAEEEDEDKEAAGPVRTTKLKIPMPNKRKSTANASSPSESALAKKSARIT